MRGRYACLLIGILLSGSVLAGSVPADDDGAPFAAIKQHLLEGRAARLRILQQGQACLQAAQDLAALRACLHTERRALRALLPGRRHPAALPAHAAPAQR